MGQQDHRGFDSRKKSLEELGTWFEVALIRRIPVHAL
jgi:hypothetical protein